MVRALLAALLLAGCVGVTGPGRPQRLADVEIVRDTVWRGRVVIDGAVTVRKGATLKIEPGTEVTFVPKDLDQDGLGDGTLIIEGELLAQGTRQQPILFASAAATPQPGDWLEIHADFSRHLELRHCEIRDAAYAIHAHFTKGLIEDCTIARNIDGSRLGQASFIIRNCLVERNVGKGINFRNSKVELERNIIRHNGAGVFLFESDRASLIRGNNVYANGDNVRLGDFFTGAVALEGNWWGTADADEAARSIHDRKADPTIGTVSIDPAGAWLPGCGPRDGLALEQAWRFGSGGFVDATVAASGERLVTASWDGTVTALSPEGEPLWSRQLGDAIDGPLAIADGAVYLQSWSREVFALDLEDGATRWRFSYPPSPADDHRQAGLARWDDLILVPAWNGTLYALDATTGLPRWQVEAGLPLRAAPALDAGLLYQPSGDGSLSAVTPGGQLRWQVVFKEPLLATPALTPDGPVAVTRSGAVAALDRTGRQRWRRDLGEPCHYGGPLYSDGVLYLGTAGGGLWKLDASSGEVIWRLPLDAPVYTTPLLAGGRLWVADNGGTLRVVGADSGDLLASFRVEREIQGSPVFFGSRVIFGSRDHHVYAVTILEPPEMKVP